MKNFTKRINIVCLGFLFFGALISWRLFGLQILNSESFKGKLNAQVLGNNSEVSTRGEIYMKDKEGNLKPLAVNKKIKVAYLGPERKQDKVRPLDHVDEIADVLDMDRKEVEEKVNSSANYLVLKKDLSSQQVEEINSLDLDFVQIQEGTMRYYPQGELAAHVVGFLGFEGDQRKGQYGLESYYDKLLSNNQATGTDYKLVTNIDYNIQFKAKEELKRAVEKYEAEGGSVVIADPSDGGIIAMATYPSFDPNNYGHYDYNRFLNPTISGQYEPGSVFKAITMAGGLEEGVVKPSTTYYDKGYVQVTDRVIRNAMEESYQTSTMVEVLSQSINTGAVFVQQQLGQDRFRHYVQKLGFGSKTGIDLAWEAKGSIFNLFTRRPINFATASFGQGISTTPIQLVRAFSAIANGGKLPTPRVVDWKRSTIDQPTQLNKNEGKQVLSSKSASRLTSMLVEVIDSGHAHRTKLESYRIAGKTGTAQVPKEDSPGYSEKRIDNFIAFAPAYKPRFVMLIKLNNPQKLRFAAGTCVRVYKRIAQYILNYWEVPPTR